MSGLVSQFFVGFIDRILQQKINRLFCLSCRFRYLHSQIPSFQTRSKKYASLPLYSRRATTYPLEGLKCRTFFTQNGDYFIFLNFMSCKSLREFLKHVILKICIPNWTNVKFTNEFWNNFIVFNIYQNPFARPHASYLDCLSSTEALLLPQIQESWSIFFLCELVNISSNKP